METYTITLTWDELMTLKSSLNKAIQLTNNISECGEISNLKDKVTDIQWK